MTKLEPPDTHHLSAAMGWLELGNATEAGTEVARISSALLEHPDVLDVRWQICAASQSWEPALRVAETMLSTYPDQAAGWIHRAYALRRVKGGGLDQAWTALRPAYEKFPKESTIPYNLACYAAQLGNLSDAGDWLHRAMDAVGEVARIKRMALADSDLQPLWETIGNW